jgi:hypothetical protein
MNNEEEKQLKQKIYRAEYYKKNKERLQIYQRAYYKEHKKKQTKRDFKGRILNGLEIIKGPIIIKFL